MPGPGAAATGGFAFASGGGGEALVLQASDLPEVRLKLDKMCKEEFGKFGECKMKKPKGINLPAAAKSWDAMAAALYVLTEGAYDPRHVLGSSVCGSSPLQEAPSPEGEGRPLVSVICPTMWIRSSFHPLLYECFSTQAYEPKELVVIDCGPQPSHFLLERAMEDPRVTYRWFPGTDMAFKTTGEFVTTRQGTSIPISLGAKRNLACLLARGEIIAHFDDDDMYVPGYLDYMTTELLQGISRLEQKGQEAPDGRPLRPFIVKLKQWHNFWHCTGEFIWHDLDKRGSAPQGETLDWMRGYSFSYVYTRTAWERNPFPDITFKEDRVFVQQALDRHNIRVLFLPCQPNAPEGGLVAHSNHKNSCTDNEGLRYLRIGVQVPRPVAFSHLLGLATKRQRQVDLRGDGALTILLRLLESPGLEGDRLAEAEAALEARGLRGLESWGRALRELPGGPLAEILREPPDRQVLSPRRLEILATCLNMPCAAAQVAALRQGASGVAGRELSCGAAAPGEGQPCPPGAESVDGRSGGELGLGEARRRAGVCGEAPLPSVAAEQLSSDAVDLAAIRTCRAAHASVAPEAAEPPRPGGAAPAGPGGAPASVLLLEDEKEEEEEPRPLSRTEHGLAGAAAPGAAWPMAEAAEAEAPGSEPCKAPAAGLFAGISPQAVRRAVEANGASSSRSSRSCMSCLLVLPPLHSEPAAGSGAAPLALASEPSYSSSSSTATAGRRSPLGGGGQSAEARAVAACNGARQISQEATKAPVAAACMALKQISRQVDKEGDCGTATCQASGRAQLGPVATSGRSARDRRGDSKPSAEDKPEIAPLPASKHVTSQPTRGPSSMSAPRVEPPPSAPGGSGGVEVHSKVDVAISGEFVSITGRNRGWGVVLFQTPEDFDLRVTLTRDAQNQHPFFHYAMIGLVYSNFTAAAVATSGYRYDLYRCWLQNNEVIARVGPEAGDYALPLGAAAPLRAGQQMRLARSGGAVRLAAGPSSGPAEVSVQGLLDQSDAQYKPPPREVLACLVLGEPTCVRVHGLRQRQ